ncbi:MAG: hypothetical protein IJD67_02620 [Clostridia bacterium]|nr:hypothetical protein [Clostridia bacterium]
MDKTVFSYTDTLDTDLTRKNYTRAIKMLEDNVVRFECYQKPVLTTGKGYPGIWLEHNHDSLFFADISPEIAMNSHRIFYDFQAEDGLFPAYICKWPHQEAYRIGYGHMQTVYPLAASALEVAMIAKNEEFLADSYKACAKYDDWIVKYRNTRGTGLVEVFCGFDTGHDNSSRIADIPKVCPRGDARVCCNNESLPMIAPDLSAMLYRARLALADMAEVMGRINERDMWLEKAQSVKENLVKYCYDEVDEFFYDLDRQGNLRKYVAEHIFRLFLNHAIDKDIFEKIYNRYIISSEHFNSKYPFASVSVSAPYFNIDLYENNWNGKTQMHTVLETLFWMEHYGKGEEHISFMRMWLDLMNKSDMVCSQEADPFTGEFSTKAPAFSTTFVAYTQFAKKLGII